MTGQPGGQPGGEMVPMSRTLLDQLAELLADGGDHDQRVRQAGYRDGQAAHTSGGYQTGYDLGHDTGLSARQDTRGYVHGILDGWAAGCEERHQLLRDMLPDRSRPERQVSERWTRRPAAREAEPEREAGG